MPRQEVLTTKYLSIIVFGNNDREMRRRTRNNVEVNPTILYTIILY